VNGGGVKDRASKSDGARIINKVGKWGGGKTGGGGGGG